MVDMTKTQNLFKFLKEDRSGIFAGGHDVFTPQPLIEEILDQIPDIDSSKTVLVLFNVEFVISLVYTYGVNTKNVTFYADHPSKVKFAQRIGVNIITNLETTMKFDVVVGNPPYQDSEDSGGTLWGKFSKKAFDVTKPNGYVALIHPPSFIGKHLSEGKGKSDYTHFANNQIDQIHLFDSYESKKHFNVGSRFCWYISKKTEATGPTKLIGYDNGKKHLFSIDFNKTTILPLEVNPISMSIHDKLVNTKGMKFKQKRELHYHTMKRKNQVSSDKTNEFKFTSHFSHKITRFSNFKFSNYTQIKVMVPQTSTVDKTFIDKDCNVSEDLFYVVADNMPHAVLIKEYLSSPLVKYIAQNYRPGRNLGTLLISDIIPDMDVTINLSKAEIDYIEANVK